MKMNLKMALVLAAAALLAACGSSDSGPETARVATADTTVAFSAATAAAVDKLPFTFAGGVPELGTAASTTVTFDAPTAGTPTFTIAGFGQGTASGNLEFGSCIFRVLSSSFPANHPLATGKTVTVNPCEFTCKTKGAKADGNEAKRKLKIKFGKTDSNDQDADVKVDRDGNAKVKDKDCGKTPTEDVTGGSS